MWFTNRKWFSLQKEHCPGNNRGPWGRAVESVSPSLYMTQKLYAFTISSVNMILPFCDNIQVIFSFPLVFDKISKNLGIWGTSVASSTTFLTNHHFLSDHVAYRDVSVYFKRSVNRIKEAKILKKKFSNSSIRYQIKELNRWTFVLNKHSFRFTKLSVYDRSVRCHVSSWYIWSVISEEGNTFKLITTKPIQIRVYHSKKNSNMSMNLYEKIMDYSPIIFNIIMHGTCFNSIYDLLKRTTWISKKRIQ